MTAKAVIIIAALAIAAFIAGVGRYNMDYASTHNAILWKRAA